MSGSSGESGQAFARTLYRPTSHHREKNRHISIFHPDSLHQSPPYSIKTASPLRNIYTLPGTRHINIFHQDSLPHLSTGYTLPMPPDLRTLHLAPPLQHPVRSASALPIHPVHLEGLKAGGCLASRERRVTLQPLCLWSPAMIPIARVLKPPPPAIRPPRSRIPTLRSGSGVSAASGLRRLDGRLLMWREGGRSGRRRRRRLDAAAARVSAASSTTWGTSGGRGSGGDGTGGGLRKNVLQTGSVPV